MFAQFDRDQIFVLPKMASGTEQNFKLFKNVELSINVYGLCGKRAGGNPSKINHKQSKAPLLLILTITDSLVKFLNGIM